VALTIAPGALVFDVDGTLYSATKLRIQMVLRMVRRLTFTPSRGRRIAKCLSAYRRAMEHMRHTDYFEEPLDEVQLRYASEMSGIDIESVRCYVKEWFVQAPLPLLLGCRYPGLVPFLAQAHSKGITLGVLSDYPAEEKLNRLEVRKYFQAVTAAGDAGIGCYKPHPKGLLAVLEMLAVRPEQALYIGDRVEVDAEAARRAGVRCFIIGRSSSPGMHWMGAKDYFELGRLIGLG